MEETDIEHGMYFHGGWQFKLAVKSSYCPLDLEWSKTSVCQLPAGSESLQVSGVQPDQVTRFKVWIFAQVSVVIVLHATGCYEKRRYGIIAVLLHLGQALIGCRGDTFGVAV